MLASTLRCVMHHALGLGRCARGEDDFGHVVARRDRDVAARRASRCRFHVEIVPSLPDRQRPLGRRARVGELHVIADQQQASRRRCGDACERNSATRDNRLAPRSIRSSRHPQSAMIHSGRFSLQNTTLSPLHEARALQARGKATRGGGGLCVRISTRAIPVVVDEEFSATSGDIAEEIE